MQSKPISSECQMDDDSKIHSSNSGQPKQLSELGLKIFQTEVWKLFYIINKLFILMLIYYYLQIQLLLFIKNQQKMLIIGWLSLCLELIKKF